MGNKFMVTAWGRHTNDGYSECVMWQGESWWRALLALRRVKGHGFGCVKLEWR